MASSGTFNLENFRHETLFFPQDIWSLQISVSSETNAEQDIGGEKVLPRKMLATKSNVLMKNKIFIENT